jgi:D-lyxose ketol-isomerase
MVKRDEVTELKKQVTEIIENSGFSVSQKELDEIDYADFGLDDIFEQGAQIISLLDTDKISVRLIVLIPGQAEPEHYHLTKQETLRLVWGRMDLFTNEALTGSTQSEISESTISGFYKSNNKLEMKPSDQITMKAGIKHWFQAKKKGALMLSFSNTAQDNTDIFTDPNVIRQTIYE